MPNEVTKVTKNELIQHLVQEKRYDLDGELADYENHLESLTNKELVTMAEDETDEVFEIDEA